MPITYPTYIYPLTLQFINTNICRRFRCSKKVEKHCSWSSCLIYSTKSKT